MLTVRGDLSGNPPRKIGEDFVVHGVKVRLHSIVEALHTYCGMVPCHLVQPCLIEDSRSIVHCPTQWRLSPRGVKLV
eukprot:5451502-Amphidinium_carterae.1